MISFTIVTMPVQAHAWQQVDLYGYVAPRCWAVAASSSQPVATAICNQSRPQLQSHMRTLNADGTLAERIPTEIAGRAALEIVVSPQI